MGSRVGPSIDLKAWASRSQESGILEIRKKIEEGSIEAAITILGVPPLKTRPLLAELCL